MTTGWIAFAVLFVLGAAKAHEETADAYEMGVGRRVVLIALWPISGMVAITTWLMDLRP